jgi:hypothetical protein
MVFNIVFCWFCFIHVAYESCYVIGLIVFKTNLIWDKIIQKSTTKAPHPLPTMSRLLVGSSNVYKYYRASTFSKYPEYNMIRSRVLLLTLRELIPIRMRWWSLSWRTSSTRLERSTMMAWGSWPSSRWSRGTWRQWRRLHKKPLNKICFD